MAPKHPDNDDRSLAIQAVTQGDATLLERLWAQQNLTPDELNALRPGAIVTMIGDSEYVLKGMTAWMPGWKANGWRTAQRKPVKNAELWLAPEGTDDVRDDRPDLVESR